MSTFGRGRGYQGLIPYCHRPPNFGKLMVFFNARYAYFAVCWWKALGFRWPAPIGVANSETKKHSVPAERTSRYSADLTCSMAPRPYDGCFISQSVDVPTIEPIYRHTSNHGISFSPRLVCSFDFTYCCTRV